MLLSCTVFELLSLISQKLKTSHDHDHAHSSDSNPNAKTLHGVPVYKTWKSLITNQRWLLLYDFISPLLLLHVCAYVCAVLQFRLPDLVGFRHVRTVHVVVQETQRTSDDRQRSTSDDSRNGD